MRPGARRAAREDPACRVGAPLRIRHRATCSPVRAASAWARCSAWSKPRARRRTPCVGTGTRTAGASSRPRGAPATICAAITSATPSAARNFNACTSDRAGPSNATGAHARSSADPVAGHRRPHGTGSPHRGQHTPRRNRTSERHAPQSDCPAATGARQSQQAGGASTAVAAARRWRATASRSVMAERPRSGAERPRSGAQRPLGGAIRSRSGPAWLSRYTCGDACAPPRHSSTRDCDNPAQWLRTLRGRSTRVPLR